MKQKPKGPDKTEVNVKVTNHSRRWLGILLVLVLLVLGMVVWNQQKRPPEIDTYLQMVGWSKKDELQTYETLYDGVVTVFKEDVKEEDRDLHNNKQIEYRLKYREKVILGIHFPAHMTPEITDDQVVFRIPHVQVLKAYPYISSGLKEGSIEVMPVNMKNPYETEGYDKLRDLCDEDATRNIEKNKLLMNYADKATLKTMEGLLKPFVEEAYPGRTLVVEFEKEDGNEGD